MFGPEEGARIGQGWRELIRRLFRFEPDPPGRAVGGRMTVKPRPKPWPPPPEETETKEES